MRHGTRPTHGGNPPDCCDPHESAELGELLRLAQCCLRLIGREGAQ